MSDAKTSPPAGKWRLMAECLALFAVTPAAYAAGWLPVPIIAILVVMAGGCYFVLCERYQLSVRELLLITAPRAQWRKVIIIYAAALPCLLLLLWLTRPEDAFSLLRRNLKIWLLVMFAYPVVSVLPQELAYRVFFFRRYEPLFGKRRGVILASAIAFSFGHIVFHNWQSMALTFIGGLLFGKTYRDTGSLPLVAFEHSLYGCAIFTLGYAQYFLDGTLRLFK